MHVTEDDSQQRTVMPRNPLANRERPAAPQGPSDEPFDALLPQDMAAKAEEIGARKAHLNTVSMFVPGVLAGAFISLGALGGTFYSRR